MIKSRLLICFPWYNSVPSHLYQFVFKVLIFLLPASFWSVIVQFYRRNLVDIENESFYK
jgi:hypothetical protein